MNFQRLFVSVLAAAFLGLTLGCGALVDTSPNKTPKFGGWTLTNFTGSITMVDTGCQVGTWTFEADPASSWNGVKVDGNGSISYYLGFKGVPGSPHPDGYDHAGSGDGKNGAISGHVVSSDTGSVTDATGSYDTKAMHVAWSMEQHVTSGVCQVDVTGSGNFDATAP